MHVAKLRQLQRVLAFASPSVVLASVLWHSWRADFPLKAVLASTVLLAAVGTLGVTLFRRSKGLEAAWFNALGHSRPLESADDPVDALQAADVVLVLAATASMLVAALQLK